MDTLGEDDEEPSPSRHSLNGLIYPQHEVGQSDVDASEDPLGGEDTASLVSCLLEEVEDVEEARGVDEGSSVAAEMGVPPLARLEAGDLLHVGPPVDLCVRHPGDDGRAKQELHQESRGDRGVHGQRRERCLTSVIG